MKVKKFILFLVIVVPVFLPGCSVRQQLHQKLIVQGVGIDMDNTGYVVTVQALDFQHPAGEDEPNLKIIEIRGVSVLQALDNISKQTSLSPVYSQNLIIVISDEVAKKGVNNFIDFFVRHCETRPKVKLCVSRGKAGEIFKVKLNNKPMPAQDIHDLIPTSLNSDVLHFVGNLKNKISDSYMALLEIDENSSGKNVSFVGAGIFSEDVLTDYLQGNEAFGFMILKGVSGFGSCVMESPSAGSVTCTANGAKCKINVCIEQKDNTPKFMVQPCVSASAFSMDKDFYTHSREEIQNEVAGYLSEKISELCRNVSEKIINSGSDVLGFGRILKNTYPQYFKNLNEDWGNFMKKCDYDITPQVSLTITGKEPV